jgi:hypothetical protein
MKATEIKSKLEASMIFLDETEERVRRENRQDEEFLAVPLVETDENTMERERHLRNAAQWRIKDRHRRLNEAYQRELKQIETLCTDAYHELAQSITICSKASFFMNRQDAVGKLAGLFVERANGPADVAAFILGVLPAPDLCSLFIDEAGKRWTVEQLNSCKEWTGAVETFERSAGITLKRAEQDELNEILSFVQGMLPRIAA